MRRSDFAPGRPQPIPLRPDREALRNASIRSFTRAVCASLLASDSRGTASADEMMFRHWPNDENAGLVLRAASNPATLTTPAWAGALGYTATADLLSSLAPASAGTALLRRCLSLTWDNAAGIKIPAINAAASYASFVGEGAPIPVAQFTTGGITLAPKKFAILTMFSREMFQYSTPTIEALVGLALRESVGLALDATLFSTNAGSSVAPPGLLNGISATAPSAQTIPSEAMGEDTSTIVAAVSAVSGNAPIVLIGAPKQATFMRLNIEAGNFEIFASTALPDKTVIALASNALASVIDPQPRFDTSIESAAHMETNPQPGIANAVTVSTFQADLVSLRLRFDVNWGLRSASGVAFMNNVSW
jgi:hypothetical protein